MLEGDYCIDESIGVQNMSYEDCVAKYDEPNLNDLYGGFDVFSKMYFKSLCTKISSSRSGSHTLVESVHEATTVEKFDLMKAENLQTTSANSYTEPWVDLNIY
jgi:hypothetical protein